MSVEEPQNSSGPPANITEKPPVTATTPSDFTEASIPLAPLKIPPTARPDEDTRGARYDIILVVLTLLFAFFQGAHEARNSDIWMHLAAGHDTLAGKYNPFSGHDPYSYSTTDAHWVNHSWLYDVVVYGVHSLGGIPAIIALHALLAAATALVLVSVGRIGPGLWPPALASALAILACSPRFLLQPAIVSFLFLALTLWFLQRGGRWNYRPNQEGETVNVTWKDYWPLLPLFVAWVNLDEWFFLGPLTVALYALGQALQRDNADIEPRPGEVRSLAAILVGGLVACLINPQHVFAFQLPVQFGLSPLASELKKDSVLRSIFVSPFNSNYFTGDNLHAAHLAFFVLAALTLLSFAVNYRSVRYWRAGIAGLFFGLACWHGRAIPFFAIVAGPIAALNAQEAARLRKRPASGHDPLPQLGRAFAYLAVLVLLVTSWPGWLHMQPHEHRRVSFADALDPSLKETALFLQRLHEEGALRPDARGFHFSPEVGNALAWFAPDVKSFFDSRYALFADTAPVFVKVRRSLNRDPDAPPLKGEDWRALLEERGIDYVVLYAPQPERLNNALFQLITDPRDQEAKDWVLLDINGHTAVFGKRDREEYRQRALDFDRLAYDPPAENVAPEDGMQRLPREPMPWAAFTDPPPSRDGETDESQMQLQLFGIRSHQTRRANQLVWERELAKATLGGSLPSGTLAPPALLTPLMIGKAFRYYDEVSRGRPEEQPPVISIIAYEHLFGRFLNNLDDGPPENLLLAIRAARHGLHVTPNNPRGLADLGLAYQLMLTRTRERVWKDMLRWVDPIKEGMRLEPLPLVQLRHVQAVSALKSSLLYRKDRDQLHARLAELYGRLGQRDRRGELHNGFKDLELEHRKAQLRYLRQGGFRGGESRENFDFRVKDLTGYVEELTKQVDTLKDRFEVKRQPLTRVMQQVEAALDLNLAGKALELLLQSNYAAFGAEGTRLQIELALMVGRIADVKTWFDTEPTLRTRLQDPNIFPADFTYLWLNTLLAAGLGDYASADEHLLELIETAKKGEPFAHSIRALGVGVKVSPAPKLTPEEGVSLLVGKAITDALLPVSEVWIDLVKKNQGEIVWPGWVNLTSSARVKSLTDLARPLLLSRIEQGQHHLFRALLALEQGDRKRAEEALEQASRLPDAFRGPDKNFPRMNVEVIAEVLRGRMKGK